MLTTFASIKIRRLFLKFAHYKNMQIKSALKIFIICALIALPFVLLELTNGRIENRLTGRWREVSWTYEKANTKEMEIYEEVQDHISKDLVIHKAEVWSIRPNGNILLKNRHGKTVNLKWMLKGRGNILKLIHNDTLVEHYQIQKLTDTKMILHFENDIHTKGLIKIEFEKLN